MWLTWGLTENPLIMALGLVSSACTDFFGILVCLDAHLPRPGGRGEKLELPTGQETLTALRTVEGGGEGVVGRKRGRGGNGRVWGGGEEVEIFINK